MAITAHVYQIYIAASADDVWAAITESDWTERYFYSTRFVDPLREGAGYRTVLPSGADAIEGTIRELRPPTPTEPGRLVQTWRTLYDAALAAEPPSEVEWTIEQISDGLTRVRVVHGALAFSPLTWAHVKDRWTWVLNGLKSVLETGKSLPPIPAERASAEVVPADWHRAQGVEANNSIWELLSKSERTEAEDEDLLRRAYAAAYHWARAGTATPVNEARAAYMICKALLGTNQPERAIVSADHCLAVCADNGLGDFDLAYAHEARARALLALGDPTQARLEWSAAQAVPIAESEDQAIVNADFRDLAIEFGDD